MNLEAQAWDTIAGELRRYVATRVPAPEVEDVVQDVLLRVVSNKASLEPDRPLGPWAQTIARNAVIDRLRKRTPAPPPDPHAEVAPEDLGIEAETEALRALMGSWLRAAVGRLPEPYKEAMHRVDVLGQPQAEVAEALGIPYSTLKSRVQRGRTKVREAFLRCCDAELDARGRLDGVRARNACECCDP